MKLLRTYTVITLWRLLLLYAVAMLCRVIFVLYNLQSFTDFTAAELPALIKGSLQFDTASLVYLDGLWLVMSLLPFGFREKKWYRNILYWYYVTANAIFLVAVNLSDAIYFRYTQKRFSAEEIFFADNSNSASLVLKFALENWYLVVAGVALILLLAAGYRRRVKPERLLDGAAYYIVNGLTLLLAVTLAVGGVRGGFSRMVRPLAVPTAMRYASDAQKANIVLSNPFCILRTAGSKSTSKNEPTDYFSDEELSSIYSPCHYPAEDFTGGDLKGRNVVIFVMESMSAEHSALLCPEIYENEEVKGYTPFLDSLMRDGFVFRRMYANGKRSIQALPTIWSSIPSFRTPFMLMPESLGETRPLPRLLRDEGYSTAFFCGSERGSMGFGAYANAAGFEHEFAMEDYEAKHGNRDFDGYWGVWDAPFLQYMGEELDALPQPFLASVFTISSHHPFVVPDSVRDSLPEGHTKIHRCVAYTDDAVRRFFAANRDKEWFGNTVFVFVADHVSSEKFAPRTRTAPYDLHIVGFIYTPDGALRGSYDRTASQVDIMPTLLGLLDYEKPYFAYGRDVLNEPDENPLALSFDGEYIITTDDYVYTLSEGEIRTVYAIDDTLRRENLADKLPTASVSRRAKAIIQQYYRHAAQKSYTVEDMPVRKEPLVDSYVQE